MGKQAAGGAQKPHKKYILSAVWAAAFLVMLGIVLHDNPLDDPHTAFLKKLCACLLLGTGVLVITVTYDKLTVLPKELWQNRRMIWRLAKNDFRKRYAGSFLGVVWAMVPPVITVLMYWIVFDRIFGSGPQITADGREVPYVLFLTAGLVPWFFFTDALSSGTSALLEYNYLVKKVLFKISVLPIIKITAALFTHIFFTCVLMLIAVIYGCPPTVHWLQLLYYTVCEFIFVLGVCYTTSAVTVFFRDLQQIISIFIQVGIWATPILWNIRILDNKPVLRTIIKMNPMCYIVQGYRSAMYEDSFFYDHFYSSTYFWLATVIIFAIGSLIFKKLKVSFADVL